MNINPSYQTIGSIFEKNFLFEVPKYQRYFSWEEEQIDDFIKDIDKIFQHDDLATAQEHFFGGIVCVQRIVPGSSRAQRELIDGQQRITTALLLVINVLKQYQAINSEENKDIIKSRIEKIKSKYLYYNDEINRQPIIVNKLVLTNADKQVYIDLTNGQTINETRDSHKKLKKAFDRLAIYLSGLLSGKTVEEKLDILHKLESILHEKCSIIFIDADSRESAYKLFQVLNDRGTGLTEGDLLKSKTLEVLEQLYLDKQATLQAYWDEILQDDHKQVEDFLRTYYASISGSRVGRTSLYDDFLKKFFANIALNDEIRSEEEATNLVIRVKAILDEIRYYRKIIAGEWPFEIGQPITEWERRRLHILVNFLNFEISLPLLLSSVKLGHKKFAELVHMLEKFMFRHKSVCNLGHQRLSILFMDESKRIRENPDNYTLSDLRNKLKNYIDTECTDEVFSVNIANLRYNSGGNKVLRYFFSTLDEYFDWYSAGANGSPKPDNTKMINLESVTIEHICAQNPVEPTPIFTGEDAHKIANLTILTQEENGEKVRNKPYSAKKQHYTSSFFEINKYFEAVDEWTQDKATEWERHIIDMALKIFVI